MTVKEIWNSCLYTTLTISTTIFLWSVGSSLKNIANTVNKWNPENVGDHVNHVVDHAADKVESAVNHAVAGANSVVDHAVNKVEVAVNNTAIRINEVVGHAIQEAGNLSGDVKGIVRDIVTETAARCGVTFAEMVRMIYDANMGIGAHFVGVRPDDTRVRNMVRDIMMEFCGE